LPELIKKHVERKNNMVYGNTVTVIEAFAEGLTQIV
jgi:hypothetical protein